MTFRLSKCQDISNIDHRAEGNDVITNDKYHVIMQHLLVRLPWTLRHGNA